MNIILITILLTLLGASLVALLVWLGVVSRKSIKFMKIIENRLNILGQVIDEDRISAENSNNIVYDNLYKEIETEINHRQNSITATQNNIEKLESSTDSRLDKLHNMIKNLEAIEHTGCKSGK